MFFVNTACHNFESSFLIDPPKLLQPGWRTQCKLVSDSVKQKDALCRPPREYYDTSTSKAFIAEEQYAVKNSLPLQQFGNLPWSSQWSNEYITSSGSGNKQIPLIGEDRVRTLKQLPSPTVNNGLVKKHCENNLFQISLSNQYHVFESNCQAVPFLGPHDCKFVIDCIKSKQLKFAKIDLVEEITEFAYPHIPSPTHFASATCSEVLPAQQTKVLAIEPTSELICTATTTSVPFPVEQLSIVKSSTFISTILNWFIVRLLLNIICVCANIQLPIDLPLHFQFNIQCLWDVVINRWRLSSHIDLLNCISIGSRCLFKTSEQTLLS